MAKSAIDPSKYSHFPVDPAGTIPVPSSTYEPAGVANEPVAESTFTPSIYSACPGISTAWCHLPSSTAVVDASPPAPSRSPELVIHRIGVAPVAEQPVLQVPGRVCVSPSSTPDAAVVLNHTLNPRLVVELVTTLLLPVAELQELSCDAVVHQISSTGIHELDPLNPVAVAPSPGPVAPRVVFISSAGGFTVVRSSTGTSSAAAVVPDASSSR